MKQPDTYPTKQPLADDDLKLANGGTRRDPVDLQIRWHCLDCDSRGDWYSIRTGCCDMEAAKAAHMAATGHCRFEAESSRNI